jgi:hypothetical protein
MCLQEKLMQSCQVLANLCVLALYNETQMVCALFKEAMEKNASVTDAIDPDHKQNLPWLYYSNKYAKAIEVDTIKFETVYSTALVSSYIENSKVSQLPFYLATYGLDGKLISISILRNELIMCSPENYTDSYTFGISYTRSCKINL